MTVQLQPREDTIQIPETERKLIAIELEGITPLLCGRKPDTLFDDLVGKTQKKVSKTKKLDLNKIYRESLYIYDEELPDDHPEKYGFLAIAPLKALVSACRVVDKLNMTQARAIWSTPDTLMPLRWEKLSMFKCVGVNQKTKDAIPIVRPMFEDWSVTFRLSLDTEFVSLEQSLYALQKAGTAYGIGCMRPEKGLTYGQFRAVKATMES